MGGKTKAKLQCFFWESRLGQVEVVHAQGIDNSFPRHSHQSYCLGLVEKGCRLILRQGQSIAIPKGSLFIIQPWQSHACRSAQADEHAYSVLCLPPTLMTALAKQKGLAGPNFSSVRIDDKFMARSFRGLLSDMNKCARPSSLEAGLNHLLSDLLARHASNEFEEQPLDSPAHGLAIKARGYLESRFDQTITLNDLSKAVGSSQFNLQRRFLKSMGCSPKEYLVQYRIKAALRLLQQGLPLSQVALETGFYDQGHFTNRFKSVMGVTPGRFLRDNATAN